MLNGIIFRIIILLHALTVIGCDINATNWMNVTALNIAARMKDENLWKLLYKNGQIDAVKMLRMIKLLF